MENKLKLCARTLICKSCVYIRVTTHHNPGLEMGSHGALLVSLFVLTIIAMHGLFGGWFARLVSGVWFAPLVSGVWFAVLS